MIQLFDLKPCSDYPDAVQAEGLISCALFSLKDFEQLLLSKGFIVYSIGNPIVLICRRADCMLIVKSDGSFNISQVLTEKFLLQIIHEIEAQIMLETRD
ncbi:MAG: hypothetical protein H0W50_03625 [Parachlamydiaceae bacterium]|nr:hypothetical protein [Parachlamydiaceae bacterium]